MNVMIQTRTRAGQLSDNEAEVWITGILVIVYMKKKNKKSGCITELWIAGKYLPCTPMTHVTDI